MKWHELIGYCYLRVTKSVQSTGSNKNIQDRERHRKESTRISSMVTVVCASNTQRRLRQKELLGSGTGDVLEKYRGPVTKTKCQFQAIPVMVTHTCNPSYWEVEANKMPSV